MDAIDLIIQLVWRISRITLRAAGNAYRGMAAREWSTTTALIQAVIPLEQSARGVRIDYEYAVNGAYYGGVRTVECFTKSRAEAFSRQYVCRSTYVVRYDPRHPANSWLPDEPSLVY